MYIKKIKDFLLKYGDALGGLVSIPVAIFSVIATTFSIIATVIALWIGHDANKTAEEAMTLARQDFDSERTAVFFATVDNEGQSITLVPTDTNQIVLRTELIFPLDLRKISEDMYAIGYESINSPESTTSISSYYDALKFLIKETQEPPKYGLSTYSWDKFPIIIKAHIVANNEAHTTAGIYWINYNMNVFQNGKISVDISYILFGKHLPDGFDQDDYLSYLSQAWSPRGFNAFEKYAKERAYDVGSYAEYLPAERVEEESEERDGDFFRVKILEESSNVPPLQTTP